MEFGAHNQAPCFDWQVGKLFVDELMCFGFGNNRTAAGELLCNESSDLSGFRYTIDLLHVHGGLVNG